MAKLITQLNQTEGNYETVFLYTFHASFSGIQPPIQSAWIQVFFPDFLTVYLGDIQNPIEEVTQELLEGGTLYTFRFGAVNDTGIAVRLGIGATFAWGTPNNTQAIVTPELWVNNQLHTTATEAIITLSVQSDFQLTHQLLIPRIEPAAGGIAYYRILLKNYGDLGGPATNLQITCTPPEGFQLDTTYPIIGNDVSSGDYQDLSQNGKTATVEDNTLTFAMEKFHGEAYELIYRIRIRDNVATSQDYFATLSWSMDDKKQEAPQVIFRTASSLYKASCSIYGPDYALPNRPINYEMSLTNDGNHELSDVELKITLPNEISFTTLTTGLFYLYNMDIPVDMSYQITYETGAGNTGTIGTYNTNTHTSITLSSQVNYASEEDFLLALTWVFPTFPMGFITRSAARFNGQIKGTTGLGTMITCPLELSYIANEITSTNQASRITLIQDTCVLLPTFSSSISSNPIRPGETFQYTIGANCRNSRLNTPVFLFLMPKELEYVGDISSSLYDYFKTLTEVSIPDAVIIPNFNENLDTLIIFAFTGGSSVELPQKARLKLTFSVRVLPTSRGDFSAFFLLDTIDSMGQVSSNRETYEDASRNLRVYSKSSTDLYGQSSIYSNKILYFVSISSRKEVKGFLDDDFLPSGEMAHTLPGEEVFYRITLANTGNGDLDSCEILDILPHIQDSGVIETSISRGSEFPLTLTSEMTASLDGSPESMEQFQIAYSNSRDPLRFGNNFDIIGTANDWVFQTPESLNTVASIKIETTGEPLLPGESISLLFKTLAPYGVAEGLVAWNSFAVDVRYTDPQGVKQHLLAVEPDKVGVQILSPDETKGRITGFVFWDEEKNGTYSSSAQRVELTNDVGVVLYNKKGVPLRVTFTSNDINGTPGQYAFSNLELDQYYIRFFIDTNIHDFSTRRASTANHSVVSPLGITPLIDLTQSPNMVQILVGIRSNTDRRIQDLLRVNRSSNQMLRNVLYDQMLIGMKMDDVITYLD